MKKLLLLCTAMMVTAEALAFGGHGHGHSKIEKGVDAIGVHVGDDEQANVDFNEDSGEGSQDIGEPMGCDPSEKVIKTYFTGSCCATKQTGSFCPNENVPSCTRTEQDEMKCIEECEQNINYTASGYIGGNGGCCSNIVENEFNPDCCEQYHGATWTGTQCCYVMVGTKCCASPYHSKECCEASGAWPAGQWVDGECQW